MVSHETVGNVGIIMQLASIGMYVVFGIGLLSAIWDTPLYALWIAFLVLVGGMALSGGGYYLWEKSKEMLREESMIKRREKEKEWEERRIRREEERRRSTVTPIKVYRMPDGLSGWTMGISEAVKDLTGQRKKVMYDILVIVTGALSVTLILLATIMFWPWGLGFSLAALIIGLSLSQPLVAIYYIKNLDDLLEAGLVDASGRVPVAGKLANWFISKAAQALEKSKIGKLITGVIKVFGKWVYVGLVFAVIATILAPVFALIVDEDLALLVLLSIIAVTASFYVRETFAAWSYIRKHRPKRRVLGKVLRTT